MKTKASKIIALLIITFLFLSYASIALAAHTVGGKPLPPIFSFRLNLAPLYLIYK